MRGELTEEMIHHVDSWERVQFYRVFPCAMSNRRFTKKEMLQGFVQTDRRISLDAAMFLGVPFRWDNSWPLRFVHTDYGVVLQRYFQGRWEFMFTYAKDWPSFWRSFERVYGPPWLLEAPNAQTN